MKRFGFDHYGAPSVFHELQAPMPQPKSGQVLLKVLGFGLNPYDARLRAGAYAASRQVKFPVVPGTDVLGQVVALGEGVSDFAVGDVVMNYRPLGGYSEYVTASATKLLLKPTALSMLDATAIPQIGIAAYTLMTMLAQQDERDITILGAAGGVGSILTQLAMARGYRVCAVARPQHRTFLESLAVPQIAFDPTLLPKTALVVDCTTGGALSDVAVNLVAAGGLVLSLNPLPASTGTYTTQTLSQFAPVQAAFNTLATVARTCGLTVRIASTLPWSAAGVQQGHQLLDAGHVAGKLVVMQAQAVLDAAHANFDQL